MASCWSIKKNLGRPTSHDNLVTPHRIPPASDFSITCRFTRRDVGHTEHIIQTFACLAWVFLVSLSKPGTKTKYGPNRSIWVTQNGGATLSWCLDRPPILTSINFLRLIEHLMHSIDNSLNRDIAWRMCTCSSATRLWVSIPLCGAKFQCTCWAIAYAKGLYRSITGVLALMPSVPMSTFNSPE